MFPQPEIIEMKAGFTVKQQIWKIFISQVRRLFFRLVRGDTLKAIEKIKGESFIRIISLHR